MVNIQYIRQRSHWGWGMLFIVLGVLSAMSLCSAAGDDIVYSDKPCLKSR